jgi:WD40 repeat protein
MGSASSPSFDGTARIWDASTSKEITYPLRSESAVSNASFSPDGKRVVITDGAARLWEISFDTEDLISRAKAILPRCLTPAQRSAFFLRPEPPAWCIEMEKWPYDTPEWKQWLHETQAGKNPQMPAAPAADQIALPPGL